MEANLEKLLKKISLESDKYKYFEGGKLVKIVGNKEKTIYHFILELETNLPLSIYQEVSSKLSIAFKPIKETILLIKANKINSNEFVYYYRYFLGQYSETSPLLKMFLDVPISTLNNICTITLNNKAELIKFESIIDNLNKDLSNVGFYYELKTIIDGEAEQNIIDAENFNKALANESNISILNLSAKESIKPVIESATTDIGLNIDIINHIVLYKVTPIKAKTPKAAITPNICFSAEVNSRALPLNTFINMSAIYCIANPIFFNADPKIVNTNSAIDNNPLTTSHKPSITEIKELNKCEKLPGFD